MNHYRAVVPTVVLLASGLAVAAPSTDIGRTGHRGRPDTIARQGARKIVAPRVSTTRTAPASCASDTCRRFLRDRNSLNSDASVEWVEGWHGVRAGNVAAAVPGIVADQGLFVSKSVSFMPQAAYWHPKKPPTPTYWTNSGAMIHFRVPKVYLQTKGNWVEDRSAGNRFKHESAVNAPRSKSNPNIEILPIQVLKVYWVKGDVPVQARSLGVDVRNQETW